MDSAAVRKASYSDGQIPCHQYTVHAVGTHVHKHIYIYLHTHGGCRVFTR